MLSDFRLQFLNQFLLHEPVIVRNMKRHDLLFAKGRAEFLSQFLEVRFLHHKDHVCPADMPFCDNNPRFWLCPGGANLISSSAGENLFCCQTPKTVPAANEQEFRRPMLLFSQKCSALASS